MPAHSHTPSSSTSLPDVQNSLSFFLVLLLAVARVLGFPPSHLTSFTSPAVWRLLVRERRAAPRPSHLFRASIQPIWWMGHGGMETGLTLVSER